MDKQADLLLPLINDAVVGPTPNLRHSLARRRLHALTTHEQQLLKVALDADDPALKQAVLETSMRLMEYLNRAFEK